MIETHHLSLGDGTEVVGVSSQDMSGSLLFRQITKLERSAM